MLTANAYERLGREARRVGGRVGAERMVELAAYLPVVERLLVVQSVGQGVPIRELAALQGVTASAVQRKLRRLRQRLADPCFVVATQFGERLPAALRPVTRSYYAAGLSLQECAARHHLTLHELRQSLTTVRCLLRVLQSEARAGRLAAAVGGEDDIDAHG